MRIIIYVSIILGSLILLNLIINWLTHITMYVRDKRIKRKWVSTTKCLNLLDLKNCITSKDFPMSIFHYEANKTPFYELIRKTSIHSGLCEINNTLYIFNNPITYCIFIIKCIMISRKLKVYNDLMDYFKKLS